MLKGFTPYERICKIRASDPDPILLDPVPQTPGLNILCVSTLL
ncbi:MAG: hypothetical protein HLUCCA12_01975 [Rhodobacteraceae bacterium HLUCCA12]|nr:MAG: hypothetical protein HLUCCA12_01975 [Rhodobacteraceae bacterium HLUCCA12]